MSANDQSVKNFKKALAKRRPSTSSGQNANRLVNLYMARRVLLRPT